MIIWKSGSIGMIGRVRFKDGRDRDVRQNSTRMGMDQLPSTVTITIRKGYGNGSTFSLILGEAETTVVGLDTPLHVYTIYDRSGYDETQTWLSHCTTHSLAT